MSVRQIAVYGAGGFAREIAWLAEACNAPSSCSGNVEECVGFQVVCFVDDNEALHGRLVNGIPVMGLVTARERYPQARIVGGVGSPQTRQRLMEKAAAAGVEFGILIHPRVERSPWIEVGIGAVICAGTILTTNIVLGHHVQINIDCTIGHDVVMGDYATLAPGVHISGCVHLGRRVYVGTGAVIINGTLEEPIVIGDDVIIAAGACVTKPVAAGLTVGGVPARPLHQAE